jgi:stage III sporulation protein AA
MMQMKCAWKELLAILPPWCRSDVDTLGKDTMQELRLRLAQPPELIRSNGAVRLKRSVIMEDLSYIVNTASRYSPWSAATAAQGYITAPGGHRIGLCGQSVVQNGDMTGLRQVRSLCIRVARDFAGIAGKLHGINGSVLIIGSPGSGKTTLLRDFIRCRSESGAGSVAVVDERGELFPTDFFPGSRTDILTGCTKGQGIEILLRTMGPATIAVDEITSEKDCDALVKAGWCGVSLLATAHASCKEELYARPVYKPLVKSHLFDTLVTLRPDKSWKAERMEL